MRPASTTRPRRIPALLAAAAAAFLLAATPAANASATLPVHDQAVEKAPAQYSDFMLTTTRSLPKDAVTGLEDMTASDRYSTMTASAGDTYYVPEGVGSALTIRGIGQWRDPATGLRHDLDARITVTEVSRTPNGDMSGAFVATSAGSFFWCSPRNDWSRENRFAFSVDLTRSDTGKAPKGLRGTTGFADLDGDAAHPDTVREGIELLRGFDGAYVRHDAHLKEYGSNGWGGVRDVNGNDADGSVHAFQHYVGATFTGAHLEVRYTTRTTALMCQFLPVDAVGAYPLSYDLNEGDGTIPNQGREE